MARTIRWLAGAAVAVGLTLAARAQAQLEMGHKTLGTLGLDAGSQYPPGVYVADQFLFYGSSELIDRNGQSLPVGLDLDVFANGIGAMAIFRLPWPSVFYNASVGVPIAHVSANT